MYACWTLLLLLCKLWDGWNHLKLLCNIPILYRIFESVDICMNTIIILLSNLAVLLLYLKIIHKLEKKNTRSIFSTNSKRFVVHILIPHPLDCSALSWLKTLSDFNFPKPPGKLLFSTVCFNILENVITSIWSKPNHDLKSLFLIQRIVYNFIVTLPWAEPWNAVSFVTLPPSLSFIDVLPVFRTFVSKTLESRQQFDLWGLGSTSVCCY